MSCTVITLPYLLLWAVGSIAAAGVSAANAGIDKENFDFNIDENETKNEICCENNEITMNHFIEKTFETPFTDKDILLKTLEEHGAKNIAVWECGIAGDVDNYKLTFEKTPTQEAYTVRISCLNNDSAEEKIEDLSNEYAMNVQEDAYLHIIDKLKENNMQIESEDVQDDNTIVLTINID